MITKFLTLILGFVSICFANNELKGRGIWSGIYQHTNGQFEMTVEQWSDPDGDGLSVDIIKKGAPAALPYASFVAYVKGQHLAEYRNIREPKSCWVVLKRENGGITIHDHCGGSHEVEGLYLKKGD